MENRDRIDILDMLEIQTIKDDNGYSPGTYYNKSGNNGLYLKAEKGSLLEKVEMMAKKKFQLENDAENYMQEARLELWLTINKYYEENKDEEGKKPDGWIYTRVQWKMMDMAKLAKSNVSTCDRKTGKYHINKIESYEQKFIEENDKLKNQKDEKFLSLLHNIPVDASAMDNISSNPFIQWFNENAEFILTRKQLEWLNGDFILDDVSGQWRLRKNILSKVEKAYNEDRIKEEKLKRLNKYLKYIEYLLDFKDEEDLKLRLLKTSKRKDGAIILDLYRGIDMKYCEVLTKICNSTEEELDEIECDKKFFYEVVDVLIDKENYTNDLKYKVEMEGDDEEWD